MGGSHIYMGAFHSPGLERGAQYSDRDSEDAASFR
jgi:hypothetical protein